VVGAVEAQVKKMERRVALLNAEEGHDEEGEEGDESEEEGGDLREWGKNGVYHHREGVWCPLFPSLFPCLFPCLSICVCLYVSHTGVRQLCVSGGDLSKAAAASARGACVPGRFALKCGGRGSRGPERGGGHLEYRQVKYCKV
jgi:hypothetical protein